jgi:hypothetical protein
MTTLSKIGLVLVAAGLSWIAGLGSDWVGVVITGIGVILAFGPDLTSKVAARRRGRYFLNEGVAGWDAGIEHVENVSHRADRIGEFWGNPKTRTFAELLIDCEEDRTLRAVLVGMLRESDRRLGEVLRHWKGRRPIIDPGHG